MDGESNAFFSQILEIDRAVDSLSRCGKLHQNKSAHPNNANAYQVHASNNSRFPNTSHYASQRQPYAASNRGYMNGRSMNGAAQAIQGQANHNYPYFSSPPPLQQQYSHNQQNTYGGPHAGSLPFNALAGHEQNTSDTNVSGGQSSKFIANRYATHSQTHPQNTTSNAPRSYSPFGASTTLPPLSRLNTGGAASSGHSTTPSISNGMSSSTSMLPPGYGRDSYAVAPSNISHSRAYSFTGSAGTYPTHHSNDSHHSRNPSTTQTTDQIRTISGLHMSSSGSGVFSPPLEHSRAASISAASTGTPSPASTAFNFYTGPASQSFGNVQSASQSNSTGNAPGSSSNANSNSRITPIGRPAQNKPVSDALAGSRMALRSSSSTNHSSTVTSSVTSPLSNGFNDGWLDSMRSPNDSGPSSSVIGSTVPKRKSLQSVWNS